MRPGGGFEVDPIGAFKQAVRNANLTPAQAAKVRQPYLEGGLEQAIFGRDKSLKEHSGKNLV